MSGQYILEGHRAVRCDDLIVWARWFEKGDRIVKQETIGESRISTVFLGSDHRLGNGPPVLFETMVFGGSYDQETDRYMTWEDAESGHAEMCLKVLGHDKESHDNGS